MDLVFSRTKKIPTKSWGQECGLCSSRHGIPIECSYQGCKQAYHTTCAIRGKLKMQAIFGKNFKGGIKLRSYCKEHSPNATLDNCQDDKIDASGVREIDMTNLADDLTQDGSQEELDYFWKYVDINEVHKNISESYSQGKKRLHIVDTDGRHSVEVKQSKSKKIKKSEIKQEPGTQNSKKDNKVPKNGKIKLPNGLPNNGPDEVDPLMIDLIYRYWMLLRTANNGQSLIKFSPSALKEREFEQKKNILKLRIELERVRNLSYMIGKREKLKGAWLKTHQNIIKRTFSIINDLNPAIELPNSSNDATDISTMNNNNGIPAASLMINDIHNNHPTHAHNHHHTNQINPNSISTTNTNNTTSQIHQLHNIIKKSQPLNGRFDESDQLINDLIDCDHIYELPSNTSHNSNHNNLNYQERSTLERRKTLSLVRRINRQLKSYDTSQQPPPMNPYAKNYLVLKRSDSPASGSTPANGTSQDKSISGGNISNKTLKFR